ncbi:MAG: Protoporphyrinogen oxidase [Bacteroidota bacterium]
MKPIVIIGAGISGLQAARLLENQGINYVLIEKSQKIGGRVQTEMVDGYVLDHGFQVLQTAYPEVQRSLDLKKLDLSYFGSGAYVYSEGQFQPFLNPFKKPFDFMASLGSGLVSVKDLLGLGYVWFRLQGDLRALDDSKETVGELIDRLGFSKKFKNLFLRPFMSGVLLDAHLSQPASLFYFYMKQFMEGDAAIPTQGMGAIASQLADTIPPEKIRLGVSVRAISDGYVELTDGKPLEFSQVILATEADAAASFMGLSLTEEEPLASETFYFRAQGDLTPYLYLMPEGSSPLLHFSCLSVWNAPFSTKGDCVISATALTIGISSDEIKAILADRLGRKLSDFSFIKSFAIPKSLWRVSDFHALKTEAVRRNIVLAGDYTQFPSLQAALSSGRLAAETVMEKVQ